MIRLYGFMGAHDEDVASAKGFRAAGLLTFALAHPRIAGCSNGGCRNGRQQGCLCTFAG